MPIFGRSTPRSHERIGDICVEILTTGHANDRAFAWNMIHEQRVNEDWGEYCIGNMAPPVLRIVFETQ
jgi:hypothetical protein